MGLDRKSRSLCAYLKLSLHKCRGSNSINAMYAAPYEISSLGIEQVVGMRPEVNNYMFHPRMNDYETQHLNNRFINPIDRKHLVPLASGIRYVDNRYTHIPQSFSNIPS